MGNRRIKLQSNVTLVVVDLPEGIHSGLGLDRMEMEQNLIGSNQFSKL